MLALFVTGFLMWVAWEMIIARKALALFIAIGTFALTWGVATQVGADSPWSIWLIEAAVLLLLLRVGWRSEPRGQGRS